MSPPMAAAREKESNLARLLGSGTLPSWRLAGLGVIGWLLTFCVCVQVLLVSPSWLSSIPCVLPTIAIRNSDRHGVAVEKVHGADGHAVEQVDTIAKRLMSNEGKVRDSLSTPHPPPPRGSDCFGKGRGTDSGG